MAKSVVILGRQPALGLAELESLFGPDKLHPLGSAVILDSEPEEIPLARLGGAMRVCKLLTTLPFTDWHRITDYLIEHVPQHTCCFEPGKVTFGISTYGFKVTAKAINATALSVKKVVKETGRPVRVVPNQGSELNSAQVLHNKMTDLPFGMELVLIAHGHETILAQTVAVQDIEAYAARDQKRPKRDARVGMLPPKLAQIIVNLAVQDTTPHHGAIVLDPFCGTGVILQEAQLMGFDVYGTDIEPRMIEYSQQNLAWLHQTHQVPTNYDKLAVADATQEQWENMDTVHFVACETYLGRPFSALPAPEILDKVIRDVDTIHKKFLQNVARQTKPGFRMCIAVPAWRTKTGFKHLPILDFLEGFGYTRVKFVHAKDNELIYHRPEQIVARELIVLKRK